MIKTYNPKRVIVSFGGQPLSGYADGTFIEVELNADAFTLTVGADGEGARSASADESGTVKLSLLQTSASNDVLNAAHATDKLTNLGAKPLMVKDLQGRTLVTAAEAWIRKAPSAGFAKEVGTREWTFETASMQQITGGN